MCHIGQRIFLLRIGQGAARPVGKARGFVDLLLGDPLDEGLIADLFAKAADHRGDLRVKQRLGDHPGVDKEDLQILTRGMEHLDHRGVAEKLVKRGKVNALGQRVHQDGGAIVLARHGKLDQAELGIIGTFAKKLGIDGHIIMAGRCHAEVCQFLGRGYRSHVTLLTS